MIASSVRQLRPQGDSFEIALLAFSGSEYETAIQLLSRNRSAKAVLLRARSFIRLGQFKRSVDELEAINFESLGSGDGSELMTLLSLAHVGLGTTDSVVGQLTVGLTLACSIGSVVHEADVMFTTALYHYTGGQIDVASDELYRLLGLTSVDSPWKKVEKTMQSLFEIRARAYDLLGHIAAHKHQFAEQANFIFLAFTELDKSDTCDSYVKAKILGNLAFVAADRDVEGVYEYVRDRAATAEFPGACQALEFEIRRNLGRCASLHGDHVGALREFRRSAEIAPNRASKIKALLDRSSLADELNELVFANEESDFALELTRQVDWTTASSSEMFALLSMSQNLADRDPIEARRLLNLFGVCKKRLNPFQSAATDLGFTGRECQADALISRREGNVDRAVQLNLDAFDLFKRVGYIGRAAIVAVELFELIGEYSYLEYTAAYSARLPQSHLARRVNEHLSAISPNV